MATYTTIEAEARERAGKGAARATRRSGKVPAVLYGAREAPSLLSLDPRMVLREVQRTGWRSRLYEVKVNGLTTRALIRAVQFHPVTDKPEHVDFQRLAAGEKVRLAVTVQFRNEGTSPGMKRGGVLNVVRHAVEVYADPETVPTHFEADLGPLDIGGNVRWSNLKGTQGITPVIRDRDFIIASVAPPTKALETTETAAAATPAPGAAAPAAGAPAAAGAAAAPAAGAAAPAAGAAPAPARGGRERDGGKKK
jgi:large subunit ribosomal protein L25